MPFDWRDYLGLARALVGQASLGYSPEAAQRTAVSRAYYAAFCFARNYAETRFRFQRTAGPKDHQNLREHFKRLGKAQLASRLNKLRSWRNDCDYEDQVPNIQQYVQSAIQIAAQVIQECR